MSDQRDRIFGTVYDLLLDCPGVEPLDPATCKARSPDFGSPRPLDHSPIGEDARDDARVRALFTRFAESLPIGAVPACRPPDPPDEMAGGYVRIGGTPTRVMLGWNQFRACWILTLDALAPEA